VAARREEGWRRGERRSGGTLGVGVAACGERRRGAARGDRRGGGWRRPWGPGSAVWGGLGGVGTGDWRGGAQTARGGGWRRKGIGGVASRARLVVALEKRNTKSVD
jgi:hypothetical protein